MNALPKPILSQDIQAADIPEAFKSWSDVIEFAATFNFKTEIPSGYTARGLIDINQDSSIRDIREALFLEYRRYNHFGRYPEDDVFQSAIAAIQLLRVKVNERA